MNIQTVKLSFKAILTWVVLLGLGNVVTSYLPGVAGSLPGCTENSLVCANIYMIAIISFFVLWKVGFYVGWHARNSDLSVLRNDLIDSINNYCNKNDNCQKYITECANKHAKELKRLLTDEYKYTLEKLDADIGEYKIMLVYGHLLYFTGDISNDLFEKAKKNGFWKKDKYCVLIIPEEYIYRIPILLRKLCNFCSDRRRKPYFSKEDLAQFYVYIVKPGHTLPVQLLFFLDYDEKTIPLSSVIGNETFTRSRFLPSSGCHFYIPENGRDPIYMKHLIQRAVIFSNDALPRSLDMINIPKSEISGSVFGLNMKISHADEYKGISGLMSAYDDLLKSNEDQLLEGFIPLVELAFERGEKTLFDYCWKCSRPCNETDQNNFITLVNGKIQCNSYNDGI